MRRFTLALTLLLPLATAESQRRESRRDVVPRDMQLAIEERWNGRNALRSRDSVYIANDSRPVDGNVAVQNGPLVIGGRVNGNVLAVNSDLILRPGARIGGDLWVIGGRVRGLQNATISGEVRIYESRINTRQDGDNLYIEADEEYVPSRRMRRRMARLGQGSWSDPIHVATAGAYNRVEGLPINIGPSIYQNAPWGSLKIDAFAVVRTGSTFDSDGGDIGHDVTSELRIGRRTGPAIGGRLFNIIDPVESWQLSETETSLAAFLFRRDYRDYFANRGVSGYGRFYVGRDASFTASFSDQRWDTRSLFNPFTIFRGDATWRPNPTMDVGRLHIANATLRYDTRTDEDSPRSGVYVVLDAEHGQGRLTTVAPSSTPRPYADGDAVSYNRGFLDARSYHVLSPRGQISFRVVGGGWLSGDPLPMQRRLSVEGPSALPGFDFRDVSALFDTGTCSIGAPIGRPAECDRIALAQVEYRGSLHLDIGDWREDTGRYFGARSDASWVMFFDAGRGWMVGTPADETTYGKGELPSLNTFRSDVGLGLDFGGLGLYAAKAISRPEEPVNFFLRLHRRF
ncbi:MAG TPA: hypothetical protein VFO55_10085 [Gemmatimonadaceae bacterium]|nr:hypothetical protein [Gemmatimonadaceae bacterium]